MVPPKDKFAHFLDTTFTYLKLLIIEKITNNETLENDGVESRLINILR